MAAIGPGRAADCGSLRAALAAALLVGTCVTCGPAELRQPNILLIVVDTLRADRLGAYAWVEPTSPNIDRLAATGVLFERMYTQAPQTQPAVSSILTGTYPGTHGVRANGIFALSPSALTLAEVLRDRGYRTGAVVGGFPLDARFGTNQGFDTYRDEMKSAAPMEGLERDGAGELRWMGHATRNFESSAEQVTDQALDWLREVEAGPFLLMVHYFDPHNDYLPPPPFAGRFSHPYAGEVAKVDHEVGRLLAELDRRRLAGRTLVVFTADHGECLGEHGRYFHQRHLVEATLHVPFLVRMPGRLPQGLRVPGLCRSVDVMPTILDLVGVAIPAAVEGRSLVPAIEHGRSDQDLVYFETLWGKLEMGSGVSRRGITDGEWRLIHDVREGAPPLEHYELYHLPEDPGEAQNLAPVMLKRKHELAERLRAFLAEHPERRADVRSPDPEVVERLKALGYL